ncbi:recombinase RecA [Butyricicoccus porcorum]|uniref:Protein RecA n=1 Tax=Butyricicoccus porcorum TaxID=1945634 RepID=A0A252F3P3_9FIRM|nr:recombinase RecA [Butyricicoccus porcorum]MCI6925780.1 recombinase RecA [Butyricicoccus porcorum]MDD6987032.1 recombinase RecA [Butyricicoccus porcorum]MDY4483046.1 recombinase RecA [Butyricicoccus porcorum]OUM20407.1 recombinase RecA [Butyricicoccus porcorum]
MAKKKQLPPVVVATDKKKALDQALAQIEKQHGANAVMYLGQETQPLDKEVISTGSIGLDMALGIGGLPRGRIIEIYGPESSGKTTLALHAIASAQAKDGIAAFIDAEHALDPVYAAALGVDVDSLLVSQPDSGDQGLEIAEQLVRSGALDIIVIDSVAALVPRAEIEGEMGDSFVGLHARLMSQALRKLAGVISKSKCVAIFINQLREKVGVIYGSPEVTTGGRALKFYASVRIDVRRVEHLKDGETLIGSHTRAKIVKNKMAPPFREAQFDIMYGEGISRTGELVDLGVEYGLIKKGGAWFTIGEQRFQGRDNAKKYLAENQEVADNLEAEIRQAIQESRKKAQEERDARNELRRKQLRSEGASHAEEETASAPEEEKPAQRRSAAVSIDADDFGEDDI